MPSPLEPAAFFDLAGLPFADLFEGADRVWDVLGRRLDDYLATRLVPGIAGSVHPSAVLVGDDIEIGPGSVVEPGACIHGPCIVGAGVEVRHGAYIRGRALIGDGAVVGHGTEVKGSVFLPGAKAGHLAYVGDSVLGRGVNLGAGTKLANLRLAGDEIVVGVEGQRIRTGLRKFGAILGDRAQTGCNAVTNPGTLLGPDSVVLPCIAVGGFHPAGSVLRGRGARRAAGGAGG